MNSQTCQRMYHIVFGVSVRSTLRIERWKFEVGSYINAALFHLRTKLKSMKACHSVVNSMSSKISY